MKKSLVIVGLCTAATLLAQGPPPGRGPRGAMGPGMMGPGMMGQGQNRTVTGAPYSAVEVTETTQTLPTGNVISQKRQTTIYRDGSGRVRTETSMQRRGMGPGAASAQSAASTPRTIISIHDPVAGVNRELDTQAKTAREMPLPGARPGNGAGRQGRGGNRAAATQTADPNVVTETLPMQTINGIQATGTRVTRTIPAGQIGNAQPIVIVHEVWMSPDLKVAVMDKTVDPRFGTTTTQLTNVTRAEPDPGLFQAPADYTVTKGRPAGMGRGPRGGGNIN